MRQFLAVFFLAGLSVAYAEPCRAGGDWPDGPNKAWFDRLQRPDNHKNPHRAIDPKSLFCCGVADTVKTKFKVEAGDERYPEDRWYAWLKISGYRSRRKNRPRLCARRSALSVPARRHDPMLRAAEGRAVMRYRNFARSL